MTEYDHVTDDMEAVVGATELPARLKDEVYEAINRKAEETGEVTVEQATDIATGVENRYIETRVDPLDPVGTVSAQSIGEPGTQMTMNTFHYAGVAEIDVTQGAPRLIELVDARKTPDTPMMTVHLDDEYGTDREKAHEVVWSIEATRILALGDVSTNVADMLVRIDLNDDTPPRTVADPLDPSKVAAIIAETIEDSLGVNTRSRGPSLSSARTSRAIASCSSSSSGSGRSCSKGIEEIERVVIRKEEIDGDEEFVLYTEGSAFGDALDIEGVDASRATCNNIHEIYRNLGVEAARETIIDETKNTLEEQGLDDVNVRHLMLVADMMTTNGEIDSIGRHGISGSKDSVLARAAFEVTVNHLLDAAIHGEYDDELDGVIENVIAGKPISLGTGDVDLRMGSRVVGDD